MPIDHRLGIIEAERVGAVHEDGSVIVLLAHGIAGQIMDVVIGLYDGIADISARYIDPSDYVGILLAQALEVYVQAIEGIQFLLLLAISRRHGNGDRLLMDEHEVSCFLNGIVIALPVVHVSDKPYRRDDYAYDTNDEKNKSNIEYDSSFLFLFHRTFPPFTAY